MLNAKSVTRCLGAVAGVAGQDLSVSAGAVNPTEDPVGARWQLAYIPKNARFISSSSALRIQARRRVAAYSSKGMRQKVVLAIAKEYVGHRLLDALQQYAVATPLALDVLKPLNSEA